MFSLFKKRKKSLDLDEQFKRAKENDKDLHYQLSLEYYRGTNLAQDKEKSRSWLEKASEAVDDA